MEQSLTQQVEQLEEIPATGEGNTGEENTAPDVAPTSDDTGTAPEGE